MKEIKKHLYNIENKKELLELETTKEYLDELDKRILKLDEYYDDDDFEFRGIENVQDLFKILIYKPTLVKSGYNNNYIQYESKGDNILTLEEYLPLVDSPKWLKNKKSTINPNNNDYKCFQYAVTLALNLDKINNHPERISKIKPFIEQYNWKDPSTSKDWKKI